MKTYNRRMSLLMRILAMCMTMLLVLSSFAFAMSYTTEGITVSKDGSTATVSALLKDISNYSGELSLIAVVCNKADEVIRDIGIDKKQATDSGEVSLSTTVKVGEGEELKYYIVDQNGAPIDNAAPGDMTELNVKTKIDSVTISWDPVFDDNGTVEYIVYKDGAEYDRTTETTYTVEELTEGEEYTFEVEVVDAMGVSGGVSEIKATPVKGMTFAQAAALAEYSAVFTKEGPVGDLTNTNVAGGYFTDAYFAWEPAQYDNYYNFSSSKITENISADYTIYILAGSYDVGDKSKNDGNGQIAIYDGQFTNVANLTIPANTIILNDHASELIETGYQMYKVQMSDYNMTKDSAIKFRSFTKHGTLIRKIFIFKTENVTEEVDAAMTGRELPDSKIFIASDSIAAKYSSGSIVGWGMEFEKYVSNNVELVNLAYPGSSTVTFPNKETLFKDAQEGDYVILCFGHNDSMTDSRGVSLEDYKANLKDYVEKIRETGAVPILLTSIPQFNSAEQKMVYNTGETLMQYRNAALEVAKEASVASFDSAKELNDAFEAAKTIDEIAAKTEFTAMYVDEGWTNRTHLTQSGAALLANLIAKGLYNHEELPDIKNCMIYDESFEPSEPEKPSKPEGPSEPAEPSESMTFEEASALAAYSTVFTKEGIVGDMINTNVAGGYFDTQYFAWEPAQWDNKYNFNSSKVISDASGGYVAYILAGSYAVGDASKNNGNGALYVYDGQENLIDVITIPPNTIVLDAHKNDLSETGYTMYRVQADNWQMTKHSVIKFNSATKNGTFIRKIYIFDASVVTDAVNSAMMSIN